MRKVRCVDSHTGVVCLELSPIIRLSQWETLFTFRGKASGRAKIPSMAAFFTWTEAQGQILTIQNLRKWNICLVEWCCMCKNSRETTYHLLLHCGYAYDLQSMVFCLLESIGLCLRGQWSCWCFGVGGISKHHSTVVWGGHSSFCYVDQLEREKPAYF